MSETLQNGTLRQIVYKMHSVTGNHYSLVGTEVSEITGTSFGNTIRGISTYVYF